MEIFSSSIQCFLSDIFHKDLELIKYGDLLTIQSLTINGKTLDGKRQIVNFNDIKLFKNIRYLEICNVVISNYMVDILSSLSYLESIVFRNCTFRKSIITLNNLNSVKRLRIESCKNFKLELIDNIDIDNLTIAGCLLGDFSLIRNSKISVLDISRTTIDNINSIMKLNLKKLVVSHDLYNKYNDILNRSTICVIVMAKDGYYIENV